MVLLLPPADASQEASCQPELPMGGACWDLLGSQVGEGRGVLPPRPLASTAQLVPASGSWFQGIVGKAGRSWVASPQPKNLLFTGHLEALLPPTGAGGRPSWVEGRGERAAEQPTLCPFEPLRLMGSCFYLALSTVGRGVEKWSKRDACVGGSCAKLLNGLAGKGGRDG